MYRLLSLILFCVGGISVLQAQFLLSKRIRVDIGTAETSIQAAQVKRASADSISLILPGYAVPLGLKVSELTSLRVYRPSQWKRGAWVGLIMGSLVASWIGEEVGLFEGLLAGTVPLGLAMWHGHSRKIDFQAGPGANAVDSYRHLSPWLYRATGEVGAPPFSAKPYGPYQQYPYLRPRRWRLGVDWGWTARKMHRALGEGIQTVGDVFDYGEYAWADEGGHLKLQLAYSLNPHIQVGAWLIPRLSVYRSGAILLSGRLQNGEDFYGEGFIQQRVSQSLYGISGEISPWRDDRRFLKRLIPRLGLSLFASSVQGDYSLDGSIWANNFLRLNFGTGLKTQAARWGSIFSLGTDWYLSRLVFLSLKWERFFYLNNQWSIPVVGTAIPETDEWIGTPAYSLPFPTTGINLGLGLRI